MGKKTKRITDQEMFEDANIGFRNFSGEERQFNDKGKRNFILYLNPERAKDMEEKGWNVRYTKPRDPDDEPRGMLQVAVKFDPIPPNIVMITSSGQTKLDEDTVGILDTAELGNVDLIVRPYNWEMNGKSGVKAYLKTMYATIIEDDLEKKYAHYHDDEDFDEPPF